MITRRSFIALSAVSALSAAFGCAATERRIRSVGMEKREIRRGLVTWYSQTGNTERIGRLIAAIWERSGIRVDSGDYRNIDRARLADYDIIAAGSPVYYYEVPENFRNWLSGIPSIQGKPVASFVTFGGEGGNQRNTAYELLDLLACRGGVPVGMGMFGAMSTFAITWSTGNAERVLRYRDRPDERTYSEVRAFASDLLARGASGRGIEAVSSFSFRDMVRGGVSIRLTKMLIRNHSINAANCIHCGTCRSACPVGAIDPDAGRVDAGRCIACLGCVNNCPANAVEMKFMGSSVYGFREFRRRNAIVIREPRELSGERG